MGYREGKGYSLQYSGLEESMDYSPWVRKESDMTESLALWASLIAQLVKNLPVTQETPVRFLGQEDPLGKG